MIDSALVPTTDQIAPPRKNSRRPLTFDRVSFMLVFLGLPLAIFLVFVVWPFVQALWYSMTDWTGFTPEMNFVGLDNYQKLLHDDIFITALWNNVLLAVVVPSVTVVLSFALATMVTVGGASHGTVRGLRTNSPLVSATGGASTRSQASSTSRTDSIASSGPKISSRRTDELAGRSVASAGAQYQPSRGSSLWPGMRMPSPAACLA